VLASNKFLFSQDYDIDRLKPLVGFDVFPVSRRKGAADEDYGNG
jgi:hypothetical protein